MTRRGRGASAAWTAGLIACATVALIGIATFMMHVHREWGPGPARSASGSPDPRGSVEPDRSGPSRAPTSPPARSRGKAGTGAPSLAGIGRVVGMLRDRRLGIPVSGVSPGSLAPSFDQARGSRVHEALDILAPAGTPVVAVEDGTVAKLFTSEAGGLTVYQFDPSQTVAYYYAHLQDYAPGLIEGGALRRGQVIGRVGSTGNADPSAPHLHFAIFVLGPDRKWWEGTPVDPYTILK